MKEVVCRSETGDYTGHHWMLDQRIRDDGQRYLHHECMRCGAMKDVNVGLYDNTSRWASARRKPL